MLISIKYTLIPYSGPGGARNKGLELASKEYVQMIDSDDYIFLAQEQEILKIVEKKSPEALIFNYKKVYEKYKTDSHQIIGNILYEGDIIEYMSTHSPILVHVHFKEGHYWFTTFHT